MYTIHLQNFIPNAYDDDNFVNPFYLYQGSAKQSMLVPIISLKDGYKIVASGKVQDYIYNLKFSRKSTESSSAPRTCVRGYPNFFRVFYGGYLGYTEDPYRWLKKSGVPDRKYFVGPGILFKLNLEGQDPFIEPLAMLCVKSNRILSSTLPKTVDEKDVILVISTNLKECEEVKAGMMKYLHDNNLTKVYTSDIEGICFAPPILQKPVYKSLTDMQKMNEDLTKVAIAQVTSNH